MAKVTPMMQQYQAIKAECRDALLFFRLGDFYELFGQDAVEASKILNITLTARNKKTTPIPMCGVPYHAAENYIAKLTKAGRKVAIAEQVSDPNLPGIVKREVVRTITPGTTFNENILDKKSNRYIAALFPQKDYFGLAFADLTTGEFQATELQGHATLRDELLRLNPAELVLHTEHYEDPDLRTLMTELNEAPLSTTDLYEDPGRLLRSHFKISTLEAFGIASWPFAIQAAGLLLHYLTQTQKQDLNHIDRIRAYHRDHWMHLDESTLRNLELFATLRDGDEKGTLVSIMDKTESPMGGRLLRRWMLQPLLRQGPLEARHEAVEELVSSNALRHALTEEVARFSDLERLLGRLSTSTGNARDLYALGYSLSLIPELQSTLEPAAAKLLTETHANLQTLEKLSELILSAVVDEAPLKITEGGFIQDGFHPKLDEYRGLMRDAKSSLREIEQREIKITGIPSLKVKFNKVFGYYIEVSKANLGKVPERYTRKQTLVNAERFVTPELKEHEEAVLTAEDKAKTLEQELFMNLRERVLENIAAIKQNAELIATLDVLLSFAQVAIQNNYCRPVFTRDRRMDVQGGRHPVVESMTVEKSFVPNDTQFKEGDTELKLITGPNMSGKSTYLRQVALIALLAQVGSFVPAESAHLPIFDRIFTRVGASDNLVRGQSTFMVEMQESALILNHATRRSLIILDEVGRGTSTYDGLSIAWAILEHLHSEIRAFTLFATHYHELIALADELPHARNYSVDVQETAKGVLFLHKIKAGGINRSYGIEVAKRAGLPQTLIQRAEVLLHDLEEEGQLSSQSRIPDSQLDLFNRPHASLKEPGKITHPALEKLKGLDINDLTPLQALNTLSELKNLKTD